MYQSSVTPYPPGSQQFYGIGGPSQAPSGASGRWQERGWQQEPHQQQQRYHQQTQPYQRQAQQHYQQPPPSQHQHQQRQPVSKNQRGEAHASTPNQRPSKRAKADREQDNAPKRQQKQRNKADQAQQQQLPQAGNWLDALRQEALSFTQQALPTQQEQEQRQAAFSELEGVARAALGSWNRDGFEVMLFGSGRAGLALHSSDLDVMITGLCQPSQDGGYDRFGKQVVAGHLRKVEREAYRRMQLRSSKLIAHARIPVLKLELKNGLELDVSLNDTGGIRAANFLQSWEQDYAVLRPLVVVLKSILKQNALGDVATGGLGSWSLANMVIAHLMAESRAGAQVDHPGAMLYSFLQRYGVAWDLNRDAVAVAQGGITTRSSLASAGGPMAGPGKLFIKDPLTGREVAGGSHRYADVMQLWRQSFLNLKERGPTAAVGAAAAREQYSVLSVLLDCAAVLRRGPALPARGQSSQQAYGGGYAYAYTYSTPQGGGSRKRDR